MVASEGNATMNFLANTRTRSLRWAARFEPQVRMIHSGLKHFMLCARGMGPPTPSSKQSKNNKKPISNSSITTWVRCAFAAFRRSRSSPCFGRASVRPARHDVAIPSLGNSAPNCIKVKPWAVYSSATEAVIKRIVKRGLASKPRLAKPSLNNLLDKHIHRPTTIHI